MSNFNTFHDHHNKSLQVEWIIPSPQNESLVSTMFYHPNAPTHHWRLKVAEKSGHLAVLVSLTHMDKNIQVKLHLRCDDNDVMLGMYEYCTKRGFGKTIPYQRQDGQSLKIFCELIVLGFGEWKENVMSQIHRMKRDNLFTDFEVRTSDDEVIRCHKLMLCCASPVIQTVAQKSDFMVSYFPATVINLLMDLVYGQPIRSETSFADLIDLLEAADCYRMSHFKEELQSVICYKIEADKPVDHVVQVMMKKSAQKNEEVMKSCFQLIRQTGADFPIKDWFLVCTDSYLCQAVNLNQDYLQNQTDEFVFTSFSSQTEDRTPIV